MLLQHQRAVIEGVRYSCIQCDHRATTKTQLKNHQKSVHENIKHRCVDCDFKASSAGSLLKHKRSIQGIRYLCNECNHPST